MPVRVLILKRFQFHKGSIKTGYISRPLLLLSRFQFHKGSIKTISKVTKITNFI